MPQDTNETSLRGTRARPRKRKRMWGRRLLRATLLVVWSIDRALAWIDRMSGPPGG